MKRALVGKHCHSGWRFLPAFDDTGNDLLLATVYGGVIQELGIGLVFLGRGTTWGHRHDGGTASAETPCIILELIRLLRRSHCAVGMYVFGVQKALYAIIAVYA
ncbi:MAG: YitT family protein [Ruminococcus sp.]